MPAPQVKNKKVLVICGPTATGKTKLAVHLIKSLFKSAGDYLADIISVDSRQVFRRMDIGTGKDLPSGSKLMFPDSYFEKMGIGFYLIEGVRVWGYDLADPKSDFSVFSYIEKIRPVIRYILDKGRLPVVVGGSGLYIKSLVDGIETAGIPRDKSLREHLLSFSREELFEKLAQINPTKAASLNTSDRKNPRRLIRAIEVSQWLLRNQGKRVFRANVFPNDTDFLLIGLYAANISVLIERRVRERWQKGFKDEVLALLKSGVSWNCQSMDSLGYKNMREFLEGRKTEKEFLREWARDEVSYAKRQMTWFNKDKRIVWFDVSDKDYLEEVEEKVLKWYYKG